MVVDGRGCGVGEGGLCANRQNNCFGSGLAKYVIRIIS